MGEQQKRSRSLYMTEEAHRLLRQLADKWGTSENQATERAIRETHSTLVEDQSETEARHEPVADELRDQVAYLREQLNVREEEIRRRDHLLAAAFERIPALSSKAEARESLTRPSEEAPKGRGGEESTDNPQEHTERRSWIGRLFGR